MTPNCRFHVEQSQFVEVVVKLLFTSPHLCVVLFRAIMRSRSSISGHIQFAKLRWLRKLYFYGIYFYCPVFHCPFRLFHNQHDALSAASPNLFKQFLILTSLLSSVGRLAPRKENEREREECPTAEI